MGPMYYIGLDVHKQKISYCVKGVGGGIHSEGWIPATRFDLDRWMKALPQPWSAALQWPASFPIAGDLGIEIRMGVAHRDRDCGVVVRRSPI